MRLAQSAGKVDIQLSLRDRSRKGRKDDVEFRAVCVVDEKLLLKREMSLRQHLSRLTFSICTDIWFNFSGEEWSEGWLSHDNVWFNCTFLPLLKIVSFARSSETRDLCALEQQQIKSFPFAVRLWANCVASKSCQPFHIANSVFLFVSDQRFQLSLNPQLAWIPTIEADERKKKIC